MRREGEGAKAPSPVVMHYAQVSPEPLSVLVHASLLSPYTLSQPSLRPQTDMEHVCVSVF